MFNLFVPPAPATCPPLVPEGPRVIEITPRMSAAPCESCGRRRSTLYDVSLDGELFIICEDCHPVPIA